MEKTSSRRTSWTILLMSFLLLAVAMQASAGAAVHAASPAKKVCKTVKQHGKKHRVCHTVKSTPTATPLPTSTPLPSLPTVPAPPNPVTVLTHLDTTHAVSGTITSANGGSLTTSGADGTTYTLTIPKNALGEDTQVTMTPISSIDNLPPGGTLTAGVQLQPDGLMLDQPGTLVVKPAKPVPVADQGSAAYNGTGDEFHLEPLNLATDRVQFDILHFSGRAMLDLRPVFRSFMWTHPPTTIPAQMDQRTEALSAQVRSGQLSFSNFAMQVLATAQALYTSQLLPHAQAADKSDAGLQLAIDEYQQVVHRLSVMTVLDRFEPQESTLYGLIQKGIYAAIERAGGACGTQSRTLAYDNPYWVIDPTTFHKIGFLERTGILGFGMSYEDPAFTKAEDKCRPRGFRFTNLKIHYDWTGATGASGGAAGGGCRLGEPGCHGTITAQYYEDVYTGSICGSSPMQGPWRITGTEVYHRTYQDGYVESSSKPVNEFWNPSTDFQLLGPNWLYTGSVAHVTTIVIPELKLHYVAAGGVWTPEQQDVTVPLVEDPTCPPLPLTPRLIASAKLSSTNR